MSPSSMKVAVRWFQHSPRFGHWADSHTVCRPRPRANFFRVWKLSPTGAFARSHSGLGCRTGGPSSIWISELAPGRSAYRIKPAADEDLGVGFAAEVAGRGSAGDLQVPLVHGQLEVAAFDDEPMQRIGAHRAADFALELFQRRHEGQVLC